LGNGAEPKVELTRLSLSANAFAKAVTVKLYKLGLKKERSYKINLEGVTSFNIFEKYK